MLERSQLTALLRRRLAAALPAVTGDADLDSVNRAELERFRALLRDYPERAGKYLRGQVVWLSAAAHGTAVRGAPRREAALGVAAAVELFQAWVLIHDDIEDDSETRRGVPALHRTVGMPIALNIGDALHVYMWRLLHEVVAGLPGLGDRLLAEFGTMISRTAEGQHLDLAFLRAGRADVSEAEYLDMVARKTAHYTVASPLRLGALLAGREPSPAFTSAGLELGVAFQIRDDVLNLRPPGVAGDGDGGYGKEFAGDLYEGKRTLILAHMLAAAGADEAAEAREILSRPRVQRTPADVERLLELIHRHGSLAHAQEVADAKARRGLAELEEAVAALPDAVAATALLDLLADVAQRKS